MKKVLWLLMLMALAAALVYAVTLTKEATERVEINIGVRGQLCLEDDCSEVIGGVGNVFSITAPDEPVNFMMLSFKGSIYRSTTITNTYNTGTNEFLGWAGKCSVLDPVAESGERLIDCRYAIKFSQNGITDILLNFESYEEARATKKEAGAVPAPGILHEIGGAVGNFPHETNNYRLVSIEDAVSGIVWHPGEEELG